jgi:hypothetical protein
MKINKLKLTMAAIVAGAAGLMMTGCQTTSGQTQSAVRCEKCKTVWVSTPGAPRASGYSFGSKSMACPDCVSAAENYFKTGELKHTCASCGGALKHCAAH